ncbi:MAG TPA: hypothetical protein DCK98_18490 [Chloroflexi bacterium]|jgi:hypothetical protein|nr:hypothetical protein [Chloroflexota bacterium]HAL27495.1 hypothetical protein [Chloroflexota bacterium]
MSARVAAWSLAAFAISLTVLYHVLDLLNAHRYALPVVGTIIGIAFLIVGALIALHRPRNPIGWIYLVCMTLIAFSGSGNVSEQYGYYALITRPGSLPAADWVVWAGSVTVGTAFATLVFFSLLLFPDGRLPSPRWRPIAGAAVVVIALLGTGTALSPEDVLSPGVVVASPIRLVEGGPLLDVLGWPSGVFAIGVALACLAAPFVRFRAASGVERQQLKWFAYGAALIPAVALVAIIGSLVAPGVLESTAGANLWPLSVAGIPIATGVAILRLRLYDIDVLINRTLVYVALSAVLVAAYVVGVAAFQFLLSPFTAGSPIAVAASTLGVVALFQPLRRRIQALVDRRFYRQRYDAERTLDAFTARLRDQVDLDALRGELLGVVADTLQPTQASVWLREQRR